MHPDPSRTPHANERGQPGGARPGLPPIDVESLPEYLSFDVFDTLLLRPFLRPVDVFQYMEASGMAGKGFGAARPEAEVRARRELRREIRLDEAYERLGPEHRDAMEAEVLLERRICRANPETVALAERAAAAGRKVIAVSDTYLSHAEISAMLDSAGIRVSKLFVSSEPLATKFDGSLYPIVLSELGIGPSDVVHIGDTPRPDVRMAQRNGIRGIHYIRQTDRYFEANPWAKRYAEAGGLGRSAVIGMEILRWCGTLGEAGSDAHEMGYRFGGPIACAYSDHLGRTVPEGARMLFVSRDGYSLMKAYEEMHPGRNDLRYVHAQRIYSYMFTDAHVPFGPLEVPGKLANRFEHQKVVKWMEYVLGFFKEELQLESIPNDPEELRSLYNGRIDEIDALRRAGAEDYRSYAETFLDSDGEHLVDCTTMKFTSQRLLEAMTGRRLKGHYYVSLAGADMDYESFHSRDRHVFGWTRINVPEFFMSSPEPPVTGWRDGSPVFMRDPPEWEAYRCSIYGEVSEGEVDYVRSMRSVFGDAVPRMDYDAVTEWAMLAADRRSPCRGILDRMRWASAPDHSDWSPLVPGLKDMVYLAKKGVTDLIVKMNSMRRLLRDRLGVPLPGPVEHLGEPVPYR